MTSEKGSDIILEAICGRTSTTLFENINDFVIFQII